MKKFSGLIVILAFAFGVALGRAGSTGDTVIAQVLSWVAVVALGLAFFRQFMDES